MAALEPLSRALRYDFTDTSLLERALTHKSRGSGNYERLEFLGDSLLGYVIADHLYRRFEGTSEGKLSRMRAAIVRGETLAEVARTLDLGKYLYLGEGEMKSGGFNRDSILADSLEAIIGAVYLDGGAEEAAEFILHHFGDVLKDLSPGANYKDAKSRLQEAIQARGLALPQYRIVETAGNAHEQTFLVECIVEEIGQSQRATGSSRREAEQAAASAFLDELT
jgi:ribonuclease-3